MYFQVKTPRRKDTNEIENQIQLKQSSIVFNVENNLENINKSQSTEKNFEEESSVPVKEAEEISTELEVAVSNDEKMINQSSER